MKVKVPLFPSRAFLVNPILPSNEFPLYFMRPYVLKHEASDVGNRPVMTVMDTSISLYVTEAVLLRGVRINVYGRPGVKDIGRATLEAKIDGESILVGKLSTLSTGKVLPVECRPNSTALFLARISSSRNGRQAAEEPMGYFLVNATNFNVTIRDFPKKAPSKALVAVEFILGKYSTDQYASRKESIGLTEKCERAELRRLQAKYPDEIGEK